MKDSEARRAEREARADVVAHGKGAVRYESGLARYLATVGHDPDADADEHEGAHRGRHEATR